MSDTQDIMDFLDDESELMSEVIEVWDRRNKFLTWVGPMICRLEGHA